MWGLKIGLRKCPLRIKSKMLVLLFLVAPLVSVFSFSPLSEEDIETLPLLKQEALIEIILIQNRLLTESDKGLIQLASEQVTLKLDLNLVQNQYQMLLTTHQTEKNDAYNLGFKHGATTGTIIGANGGGLVGFSFGRME